MQLPMIATLGMVLPRRLALRERAQPVVARSASACGAPASCVANATATLRLLARVIRVKIDIGNAPAHLSARSGSTPASAGQSADVRTTFILFVPALS
jgi:hypothetical protein